MELDDYVAHYVSGSDPGHAVGVYGSGGLISQASAGLAVLEHDVPIGMDTVFDIGSASKHFTAVCLVLLERDGHLSLDDDVRVHLPELALGLPVTLRQCLSHTSGLREYISLCDLSGVPMAGMDEARLMPLLAGQAGLNFPPGTSWSYSNTGFVLAAATVRRLTGMSLAEFSAGRLFGPLGMRVTHFRDDLAVPVRCLASGYTPGPGGWSRVDLLETMTGDGAVVTSIQDLARWQEFMLTGSTLGAEVRDALLQPAVIAGGRRLPYALGLQIARVGGHRMYLHSGFIFGFRSVLAYLIDDGAGIAVLANRDDTDPAGIAVSIAEHIVGVPSPAVPARLDPASARAAQDAVAGRWYSADLDVYATLEAADDGSIEQAEGGTLYRFAALADGSWRGIEGNASTRLRIVDGDLWYEDTVGDELPEIYHRAGEPPTPPAPDGTFYSDELRAYATLTAAPGGTPGSAKLAIGQAKWLTVTPAGPGEWAGEGVTVRLLDDGASLEITCYGAMRTPFNRIDGPAPLGQRGLTSR